jgi:hypothetical protein
MAYVLSTEFAPDSYNTAELKAIHLLDRARSFPAGCTGGNCNTSNRDFILLSDPAQINSALANGYRYLGVQGYVFAELQVNTKALYLRCKLADDDCAVFEQDQLQVFANDGYTQIFPGSSNDILGYAFGTLDSDSDGLPDGFEYVAGTNINASDSDGDGQSDELELPMTGMPRTDPCDANPFGCGLAPEDVFANGFEN